MASKSMQALFSQNSVIRVMFEEGERLRRGYGSDKVYDSSLGNPDVPTPAEMEQIIREVLAGEPSVSIHDYMNNAGFADLRTAIVDSLQERFGLAYRAGQLIMTTGAAAVLSILLKTVLNPRDEVLTFAPYFSEYKNYVQNYGGVPRLVTTSPEAFLSDLDTPRKAIGKRTHTFILNTSSSPSGVVYLEKVFRGIQGMLAEKKREFGSCILVISDGPYRELIYNGAMVPWTPALMPHAAVVYSYSRTLSFSDERISWLLLPDNIPEAREPYAAAVTVGRISGLVNTLSLIQHVPKRTFGRRADFSVCEHNWVLLPRELPKMGYRLVGPEGAFYLLIQALEDDGAAFATTLEEERILIVPCKSFACPDYARLAYCVVETTVQNALLGSRRTAESYRVKGLL